MANYEHNHLAARWTRPSFAMYQRGGTCISRNPSTPGVSRLIPLFYRICQTGHDEPDADLSTLWLPGLRCRRSPMLRLLGAGDAGSAVSGVRGVAACPCRAVPTWTLADNLQKNSEKNMADSDALVTGNVATMRNRAKQRPVFRPTNEKDAASHTGYGVLSSLFTETSALPNEDETSISAHLASCPHLYTICGRLAR